MNEYYRRLFQDYERKRKRLMIRLNRRIRKIYQEIAEELPHPSQNEEIHLFTKRYQEAYRKAQDRHRKEITALIAAAAVGISSKVRDREQTFVKQVLQNAEKNHGLAEGKISLSDFKTSSAIEKIINGKFYKDKFSLSDRIWNTDKKARERIDYIIQEGIRKGKSSLELAKDLEQFVNPDARKDWEWRKVYPNAGNTTIDYNAQRLARTAVMHAYQEQTRQSARENPFCKGIKWHSALIHNRTCELCESRHGRIYSPDDLPLDHPNGLCTMIPVIEDSLEKIGKELGDWARGAYNPKLDRWMKGREKQEIPLMMGEEEKYYSKKEAIEITNKADSIVSKHVSKKSKWSGKVSFKKLKKNALGGKEWNCDIVLNESGDQSKVSIHILIHEHLHARSISYFEEKTYHKFKKIEEASVHFLSQEICRKEGIRINESDYDDMTDLLRRFNKTIGYGSDYDFAKDLFAQEVPDRYDFLCQSLFDFSLKTGYPLDEMKKIYTEMKIFEGK